MSKFTDLRERIWGAGKGNMSMYAVDAVLKWLDEHPNQVPGRTITAGEVGRRAHLIRSIPIAGQVEAPTIIDFLEALDITVVPDPEPTNAEPEHDRDWWIENANTRDAEDCEACGDDLCPVHHGIALGIEFVAKKIAALGDDPELFNSIPNPPKAPEADDD